MRNSFISFRSTTLLICVLQCHHLFYYNCHAFTIGLTHGPKSSSRLWSSKTSSTAADAASSATENSDMARIAAQVEQLKKVLSKEYISFFDPMERDYYAPDVTFDDPMTSIAGVDAYQNNVDMLASRTLLGKFLFKDAGIVLHSIQGGDIVPINNDSSSNTQERGGKNGTPFQISQITTRWTLRLTAKVLPWSPTARFTGISVYDVKPGGPMGVQIVKQADYWDSINIAPNGSIGNEDVGGTYRAVDKSLAVADFLNQLKPDGNVLMMNAPSVSEAELPYQLLRRGNGYDVRRYPSYTAVQLKQYSRRDEAFATLGSFCSTVGVKPLAPAIITVCSTQGKTMTWPLFFAAPGQSQPPTLSSLSSSAAASLLQDGGACEMVTVPEKVVAVATFSDASVEPLVRKVDQALREACRRDGIIVPEGTAATNQVQFAQYDAIFTMGKRRGEVWIELEPGNHPW